jgi:proton-translocating NADH-quinone oxidoreductase chain N
MFSEITTLIKTNTIGLDNWAIIENLFNNILYFFPIFNFIEWTLLFIIIVYFTRLIYLDFFTFNKNFVKQSQIDLVSQVINGLSKILSFILISFLIYWYSIYPITQKVVLITKEKWNNSPFENFNFVSFEEMYLHFFTNDEGVFIIKLFICFLIREIIKSLKYTLNKVPSGKNKITIEFPFLIAFVLFFLLIICSSKNLVGLYLGMVGYSILIYLLMLNNSNNENTREATLKYFILSGLSSGLFVWGILALHCAFGAETNFDIIKYHVSNSTIAGSTYFEQNFEVNDIFLIYSLILIIFAFLFKLTAFPASLWVQDVYIGCSYPVLSILLMPAKLAIYVGFTRLLNHSFLEFQFVWKPILIFAAIGSLLWGSLNAINELNIKKFLAYSSITHMGYILLCGTFPMSYINAYAVYYFLFYILTSLPFLLILTWAQPVIKNENNTNKKFYQEVLYFSEFENIRINNPWVADILVLIIFAMAGIPPFATFMAKYLILGKLYFVYNSIYLIVLILFVNLVSSYYYIKLLKIFLFNSVKTNILTKNEIYFNSQLPLTTIKGSIYFVTFATLFYDSIFEFILTLNSNELNFNINQVFETFYVLFGGDINN